MCERFISKVRRIKIMELKYKKRHIPANKTETYLTKAIEKRNKLFNATMREPLQ